MDTLIPQYEGRPAVVEYKGGLLYLSLHDASYIRQEKAWKRLLADSHPERQGGSNDAFIRVKKAADVWREKERLWYATHGRVPPPFGVSRVESKNEEHSSRLTSSRVLDALRQRPMTPEEVMEAACVSGPNKSACLHQAIKGLRNRGAVIVHVTFRYNEPSYYVLVSEDDYKQPRPGRRKARS